ncbi:MAG TPA: hypothetical protein VHZ25_17920 [Acidobacteriaceae bacterium]|jgi:hypothetical protein|nr:hypothetical protein [Acidobacteriaceae bacterium]
MRASWLVLIYLTLNCPVRLQCLWIPALRAWRITSPHFERVCADEFIRSLQWIDSNSWLNRILCDGASLSLGQEQGMSCEVIQSGFGPAFVCGTSKRPKPCHFCGSPSLFLCDFKGEHPTITPIADLRVGDRRAYDNWRIVYHAVEGETVYFAVEKNGGAVTQSKGPIHGVLTVLRPGTCDEPCCYNCAREVDEDVHYCRGSHWSLPS